MITTLSMIASAAITEFGGSVDAPSDARSKPRTTTIRVNEVVDTASNGTMLKPKRTIRRSSGESPRDAIVPRMRHLVHARFAPSDVRLWTVRTSIASVPSSSSTSSPEATATPLTSSSTGESEEASSDMTEPSVNASIVHRTARRADRDGKRDFNITDSGERKRGAAHRLAL